MQWLIDIAIKAMEQYLADNPRFVDRGDPADWDFGFGDFIKDNAWHTLDLSGIVPEGVKAVLIRYATTATSSGYDIWIRKKGNTNQRNAGNIDSKGTDADEVGDMIISPDENRQIEYLIPEDEFTVIKLVVGGWWL